METLVLDATMTPMGRTPWYRAVALLLDGKAEVLAEYDDRWIGSSPRAITLLQGKVTMEVNERDGETTASCRIKMPCVIRFLRALRGRKRAVKFSRSNIYARDEGRCQYCNRRLSFTSKWTYDHVTPRRLGGTTTWENVVVCCDPCNQRKGGQSCEVARMRPLHAPARPKKLPDVTRLTLTWRTGMPPRWKDYLASYTYWNGELEEGS